MEKTKVSTKVRNKVATSLMALDTMLFTLIFSNPALANAATAVTISPSSSSAKTLMGKIIGVILDITMYAGVGVVVFGVYETVMSFMNDQPEKKVKGITMALAGVVMIGLKGLLTGVVLGG